MKNKEDLNAASFGNGMTVYNRAVQKNGDYKNIAHISYKREVTWFMKRPTQTMKDYVEAIVRGPNHTVSTTQLDQFVFEK